MRKIKMSISLLFLLMIGTFFIKSSDKLLAAPPSGTSDLSLAPGINIVDVTKPSSSELPYDYNFKFVITDDLTYVPFGEAKNELFYNKMKDHAYTAKKSRVFKYLNDGSNVEKGVWIYNAAYYNGRKLKVKLVFDDINIKKNPTNGVVPYANFFALDPSEANVYNDSLINPGNNMYWKDAFLMMGSNGYYESTLAYNNLADSYTKGDSYSYHYEFYDDANGDPVEVKGVWSYGNVNNAKSINFNFDGSFSNISIAKLSNGSTNFGYKVDTVTNDRLSIFNSSKEVGNLDSRLDNVFSGSKYYTSFALDQSLAATSWGYPMTMLFYTESLSRVSPSKPVVKGLKNDSKYSEVGYTNLEYSILVNVADNTKVNRNTSFKINSIVPEYYDIDLDQVKIYEIGRYDTTYNELFSIKNEENNKSGLVLEALDPTSDAFNGKYFEIRVSAKTNSKFEFEKSKYDYQISGADSGYMRFDQGASTKLSYEVKDSESNEVINSQTMLSEVNDESTAKVKYEGIPDGDVKEGLTFVEGTDFANVDVQTTFVENLRVNTDNEIDKPVTVSYKSGNLPDSSTIGTQNIVVNLTSAQGVVTEKVVPISITKKTPDIDTITTVSGVDMENLEANGEFKKILDFGNINKKVFNYGEEIDISTENDVVVGKEKMSLAGWEYQGKVEQIIDGSKVTTSETSIVTSQTGTIVNYLYKAKLGTIRVSFVTENGDKLVEDVSMSVRIPDGVVDLTKEDSVTNTLNELENQNYQIETRPANETSLIPEANKTVTVKYVLRKRGVVLDPQDGVTPFTPQNVESGNDAPQNETKSDLRIQYVSNFDFGATNRNLIVSKDILSSADYGTPEGGMAKKVPTFVSVNDDRKHPTGWDLSVSTTDFVQNTNGTVLKGAYMTLSNFEYKGTLTQKPEVATKPVEILSDKTSVSSDQIGMNGSWSLALGDLTNTDKSSGVNLTVPKNAAGSLGEYSTNIVWTLAPELTTP